MNDWNKLPDIARIERAIEALKTNGIESELVQTGDEAKQRALSLIPEGAEVMTMTSVTADTIGLTDEINDSGKYDAVRPKLYGNDLDQNAKRKLGAAPDYVVGSVHGVTEDGQVVIASNTGSQLPAYAYAGGTVIWVVGAQKLVKDLDEAQKRLFEHTLPRESDRAHKAYGVEKSNVSKQLIISREVNPGRLKLIFINEVVGF
jgi:hypothetical protein